MVLDIVPKQQSASEELLDWLRLSLSGVAHTLEYVSLEEGNDSPTVYACDAASVALYGIIRTLEAVNSIH